MTREVILTAGQPQEFYEVGDFVRILSATGPLTIEFYNQGREVSEAVNVSKGYAEKFDRGTFDRVRLVSATTQPVQFVTRLGNVVNYDAPPVGDTAIVSSVPLTLDAAALLGVRRPQEVETYWNNSATLVANTPIAIFAAAANPNGSIVWSAESMDFATGPIAQCFLAKATAPANVNDGEIIAQGLYSTWASGGINFACASLKNPVRIAAGLGLYFISSVAGSASQLRSCRYKNL